MTATEAAASWSGGAVLDSARARVTPASVASSTGTQDGVPSPLVPDSATRARRDAILTEQVARETPWVMLALALLIVLFDGVSAAAGWAAPLGYYLSDVVQGAFFLLVVVVCRWRLVPVGWTPWLFATAIVLNVAVLAYQQTVDPAGNSIGVILISTVLLGGLLALWRPFVVSSASIVMLVTVTLLHQDPEGAVPWIIALVTGVGASAALLFARRRSAMDLAVAQQAIEGMAIHDQATSLLNRRGLMTATGHMVSAARRHGQPIFAVFIDVVGLKAVNDRYGHGTGDLVITRCADAVLHASRACDLIARWGGDEFVVVGVGPAPDREELAERITAELDTSGLEGKWSGRVSVGTARREDDDVLAAIDGADVDMYASRAAGVRRAA